MIEVGMVITTDAGEEVVIDSVAQGKYGIRVTGKFDDGLVYGDYLPYELPPPEEDVRPWYNWANCAHIILPLGKGIKVGCVSWSRVEAPFLLEDCEARMKETWEIIRKEEQEI